MKKIREFMSVAIMLFVGNTAMSASDDFETATEAVKNMR